MIQFTKILLSEDNKNLIIKAKIEESSYFENVYLDSIIIDDVKSYDTDAHVFAGILEDNFKEYEWVIPVNNILTSLTNNMLFIKIKSKGVPSFDCPCNSDINEIIGVFADVCSILNNINLYSKELNKDCQLPKGFIDYLLLFKALEYALKSCNYDKAIKYWKKLQNTQSLKIVNKCGCNG